MDLIEEIMEKPIYRDCKEYGVKAKYCKWTDCTFYEECNRGEINVR